MASYVLAPSRPPGGRPPFEPATAEQKRIFLKHYARDRRAGEARKKAELPYAKYKHALASDPEFLEAHREIDQFLCEKLQEVAETLAVRGDGAMVRWMMERLEPEKWDRKQKVEVTHRLQSVEDVKKLSDEDILAEFELMGIEVNP